MPIPLESIHLILIHLTCIDSNGMVAVYYCLVLKSFKVVYLISPIEVIAEFGQAQMEFGQAQTEFGQAQAEFG